jgi:polysaccharide pyruvyl transferase WcaK-like protein
MMKTYIYGAYGTGNLGDDALLKSALECYGTKDTITISYGKPFLEQEVNWIEHFEFIKKPEKYLNKGDKLIYAGGGLFWASSHADDMLYIAKAAHKKGCTIDIDRIGAQGVHCNPESAKSLFDLCGSISFRDQASVDLVSQLGLTERGVTKCDLALSINDIPNDPYFETSSFKIGINHSATPFFYDKEHQNKTLHVYHEITKHCPDVEFYHIPHTRHFNVISQNDVINGEYFWKFSGGRIHSIPFPDSVEELLKIYSSIDGFIGWRYHMLVLATLMGKPAAHLGQLGGHKYGAFATDHNLPKINFDASTKDIIASGVRFIRKVQNGKATVAKPLISPKSK